MVAFPPLVHHMSHPACEKPPDELGAPRTGKFACFPSRCPPESRTAPVPIPVGAAATDRHPVSAPSWPPSPRRRIPAPAEP